MPAPLPLAPAPVVLHAARLTCDITDSGARIRLRIPEDLAYLEGHFPQTPIVPGVVLTQWAIDEAAALFGHERRVAALSSVKFHHVMMPGDEVDLTLVDSTGSTQFAYAMGDTRYASGKIQWRNAKAS